MSVNVLQQRTATEGYDVMGGGTKQPVEITVDTSPTADSTNPVSSGGVYTALESKQDTLTFDDVPTNGSTNPVKSDGIFEALAEKNDKIDTNGGTYSYGTTGQYQNIVTVSVPAKKAIMFSALCLSNVSYDWRAMLGYYIACHEKNNNCANFLYVNNSTSAVDLSFQCAGSSTGSINYSYAII